MKKFSLFFLIVLVSVLNAAEKSNVSNAALDNIMTRTSIRSFKPDVISAETETVLLKAAMAAPSAINRQPWAFVVIRDPKVLAEIGKALRGASRPLKTAPMAIVVCGDMAKTIKGEANQFWVQDLSAATENLLLAANACKLGAVWCGVYPVKSNVEKISTILNLPADIVPLNVIAIGYPVKPQKPKNKWNPAVIHYNKW